MFGGVYPIRPNPEPLNTEMFTVVLRSSVSLSINKVPRTYAEGLTLSPVQLF